LSLFYTLKNLYNRHFKDNKSINTKKASTKVDCAKILSFSVVGEKENLKAVSEIISKSTYLYPRMHSSINMFIDDVMNQAKENKSSKVTKIVTQVIKVILDGHLFKPEFYM